MKEQSGIYSDLGYKLRAALKSMGMTQLKLAHDLGFTSQQISNWKKRKFIPSQQLIAVETYFDMFKGTNNSHVQEFRELLAQMRKDILNTRRQERINSFGGGAYGSGGYGKFDDHGNGVKVASRPNDKGGRDYKVLANDKVGVTDDQASTLSQEEIIANFVRTQEKHEREEKERLAREIARRNAQEARWEFIRKEEKLRNHILEKANPAWREHQREPFKIHGRGRYFDYTDDKHAILVMNRHPRTGHRSGSLTGAMMFNLALLKQVEPNRRCILFINVPRKYWDSNTGEMLRTTDEDFKESVAESELQDAKAFGIEVFMTFGEMQVAEKVCDILNWTPPTELEMLLLADEYPDTEFVYPGDPEWGDS